MKNSQTILIEQIIQDSLFEQSRMNLDRSKIRAWLTDLGDQSGAGKNFDTADKSQVESYIRSIFGSINPEIYNNSKKFKFETRSQLGSRSSGGTSEFDRVRAIIAALESIQQDGDSIKSNYVWIIGEPRKKESVNEQDDASLDLDDVTVTATSDKKNKKKDNSTDDGNADTNIKAKRKKWFFNVIGIPKTYFNKNFNEWAKQTNFNPGFGKLSRGSVVVSRTNFNQLKNAIGWTYTPSDVAVGDVIYWLNSLGQKVKLDTGSDICIWNQADRYGVAGIGDGVISREMTPAGSDQIKRMQKLLRYKISRYTKQWRELQNTENPNEAGHYPFKEIAEQFNNSVDATGKADGVWGDGTRLAVWFVNQEEFNLGDNNLAEFDERKGGNQIELSQLCAIEKQIKGITESNNRKQKMARTLAEGLLRYNAKNLTTEQRKKLEKLISEQVWTGGGSGEKKNDEKEKTSTTKKKTGTTKKKTTTPTSTEKVGPMYGLLHQIKSAVPSKEKEIYDKIAKEDKISIFYKPDPTTSVKSRYLIFKDYAGSIYVFWAYLYQGAQWLYLKETKGTVNYQPQGTTITLHPNMGGETISLKAALNNPWKYFHPDSSLKKSDWDKAVAFLDTEDNFWNNDGKGITGKTWTEFFATYQDVMQDDEVSAKIAYEKTRKSFLNKTVGTSNKYYKEILGFINRIADQIDDYFQNEESLTLYNEDTNETKTWYVEAEIG